MGETGMEMWPRKLRETAIPLSYPPLRIYPTLHFLVCFPYLAELKKLLTRARKK